MREVVLDPRGRLQRFRLVPTQFDDSRGYHVAPEWNTLFEAAGLSMSSFVEATPQWAPPDYADVRAAWTGTHPTRKDVMLRIEAAAYRGKPVFFDLIGHGLLVRLHAFGIRPRANHVEEHRLASICVRRGRVRIPPARTSCCVSRPPHIEASLCSST